MTKDELIQVVNQLSTPDLEDFVTQVLELRAKRRSSFIPHSESELLKKINQGLPSDLWDRIEELAAKSEEETLTSEEHSEYIELSDKVRQLEVEQVKLLGELADLRGITLAKLMQDLEIGTPVLA